jgi:hypothetical protein
LIGLWLNSRINISIVWNLLNVEMMSELMNDKGLLFRNFMGTRQFQYESLVQVICRNCRIPDRSHSHTAHDHVNF